MALLDSQDVPQGCVARGLFEKRQYSKLSMSKMSTKRAVRAGVRFGAVTAKWERRCFYLLQSGELIWNEVKSSDVACSGGSCIVLNANITSEKATLVEEIGDYLEHSSPYYLLIATATRRLTIRTDSKSDRDHFMATLKEVAGSKTHEDHKVSTTLVDEAEMLFALAPMYWQVNSKGTAQMVVSRAAFRALCKRNPALGDLLIVDVIFDGLVADHSHTHAGLTFDRFLRYVKCLSSRSEGSAAFDAVKLALSLEHDEPLVRTEDLVQSTTPSLLLSNGTLFLTHRYLIHQGWNLDTINVIPLHSIKGVGETTSSGLLAISDTLELVGVDVYEIAVDVGKEDPIHSTEPKRDVKYQLQFSRFKDMILSSGEERDQGGRRGLWMDLLREFSHAYSISKNFAESPAHPSAATLPDFVAMNLVHSRAVFRSSGHYSKSLLLCISFTANNQAAQRIINSFLQRKVAEVGMGDPTRPDTFPEVFSTGKEVMASLPATMIASMSSKQPLDEWRHATIALLVIFASASWSSRSDENHDQRVIELSAPIAFVCCCLIFFLRIAEKSNQKRI